nr:MAG TPA: structural protein [Caudoviricetes sp.]
MANYILGDVMKAEAFVRGEDGKLQHYFSANTMTDSTLNISVTAEEVRGGWGNQLLGKIFHDTNFGVNLTEAMWSLDYLAAQIGEEVKKGAGKDLKSVAGTVTDGALTVTIPATDEIAPMFDKAAGFCAAADKTLIVWVKDCNDEVFTYTATKGESSAYTFTAVGEAKPANGAVCVTYPTEVTDCEQLIVTAAYAPKEFSLFLYGKLFAGNGCQKSKGKYAGKITIEIPRFQLDGSVDLTMNPSSAASVSLNGQALASGCSCDGEPQYATITTIINK